MGDKIHPTHFQITKDMPWREKEKQSILLFHEALNIFYGPLNWEMNYEQIINLLHNNPKIVDFVRDYK